MATEYTKPDFTYLWASSGSITAPSNVKIQEGWTAEVPPFQWENFTQNRQDQMLAHIDQHGVAQWSATTEYFNLKSYVVGTDGFLYQAVANTGPSTTPRNPVTDVTFTYWTRPTTGRLLAVRVITSSGTYTPTAGMKNVFVRIVGGSGGSGAVQTTAAGQQAASPGSASGSYCESWLSAATIGASQTVTIGTAGTAGIAGGAASGTGGTTSLGALMVAPGGTGGAVGVATAVATPFQISGAAPGAIATGGNVLNLQGQPGRSSTYCGSAITGEGGSNPIGVGGAARGIGLNGLQGTGYGAGSSGSSNDVSSAAKNGIAGSPGVVIIVEFA